MNNLQYTIATVAKARAIYGKGLKESDYKELVTKQKISDVAAFLQQKSNYEIALSKVDSKTIHRGQLENVLRKDIFYKYIRLCKFNQLDRIDFFNYFVHRLEIDEILSCISFLNADKSDQIIFSLPTYLEEHFSYNLMDLASVRDYDQLLKVIKHTMYYSTLCNIKPDENGLINYTKVESLLRTQHFSWMIKAIDKDFNGDTAVTLKKILLNNIELINIVNAFREIVFFKKDPSLIQENLLPFKGKLTKNTLNALLNSKTSEDFLRIFRQTSYASRLSEIKEKDFDRIVKQIRYNYTKAALKTSQSAPVALFSLMLLLDIELNNIICIIEGIRYKTPSTYIENILII